MNKSEYKIGDENHSIHVEKITPICAARMLAKSGEEAFQMGWRNRPLNRKWVNSIALEMKRGRWKPNGKSIIISREGIVGDGQHRVSAIIKSGVTIYSHVYRRGNLEDFATWGWVKARTLADAFCSGDEWMEHGAAKAGLVSAFVALHDAQMGKPRRPRKPSHTEGWEIWKDNPDLLDSFEFCRSAGAPKFCHQLYKASKLYACHCMFTRVAGRDEADEFIRKLISGTDMTDHNPAFVLREKLFRLQRESAYLRVQGTTGLDTLEYNYVIYAWNKTREGKTINRISLGPNKTTKMLKIK
jgi:hypothetical protein